MIKFTQRRAQWQNENITNASDKPALHTQECHISDNKISTFSMCPSFSFAPHQRYWINKYYTAALFCHTGDIQHYHWLQQSHQHFSKHDRNLVSQTNSQTNSGPFCNEWFDQTNGKIPTIVESIGFIKSFTMVNRIQCESVTADVIHQKQKWTMVQHWVTDLYEYFKIFWSKISVPPLVKSKNFMMAGLRFCHQV